MALALQLLWQQALLPAGLVLSGGLLAGWGWWTVLTDTGGRDTRRLRLHPDGRVVLLVDGVARRYRLSPASLRLGRQVVLVLCSGRQRIRLLLGPGNLSPEDRAALGRWLQGASPAGRDAGVLG